MKLKHKLIYTIALGLFLSSCDNKLDVKPVTNLDASSAVQTSADVEAILIGAYDSMGDADVLGGNPQRDAEHPMEPAGGDDGAAVARCTPWHRPAGPADAGGWAALRLPAPG